MRNLKRALSLALASIMLLGMMVTGAGAASNSFTDFDQIVNQEAAEVTSGLGIFDGYTDGSFGPENVVTRAEMAVIICKLLNGSDVDPGNFTGISKFTDVPAWAEGYVNYCAAASIVVGVGEGKFNPSATVTTVEAATMLLKALGYFTEEDKLKEDWKTVVTGRATTMGLYGSLVLKADEGLTRDNVAELVFNTLFAQRVAYDDNRQLYVKNTNRDVVVTNGTQDYKNTLAENTFGMWVVDGLVTANSCTTDDLSETTNNAPRTNVVFDATAAQDYPAHAYQGGSSSEYPFEYTTGLDMIGHAARVYYKMERNAPVVFAIADRATKVAYITYNSNNAALAEAANAAGFRRNTINQINEDDYKVNYAWDVTYRSLFGTAKAVDLTGDKTVDPAKTLLVISNSSDSKVDYVIVLDQYLDTVKRVVTRNDVTEYDLTTVDGVDQNILHGQAAQGDYVVVTDIGKSGDMLNFEPAEKLSANITKITGKSDSTATVKSIVADGTTYVGSPVYDYRVGNSALDDTTDFEDIATIGEATLLLDFQGKCIGLAQPESTPNYAYAAQFGVWHTGGSLNTEFKLTVKLYFLDGTSGVYLVNTADSQNSNTFYKLKMGTTESAAESVRDRLNGGSGSGAGYVDPTKTYDTNICVDNGTLWLKGKNVIETSDTNGLGIYKVSVRADDTVVMTKLGSNGDGAGHDSSIIPATDETKLISGHSTFVKQNGSNLTYKNTDKVMYQNNKTVYFYVDGSYNTELSVGAKYGVSNAISITNNKDKDDNTRKESFEQILLKGDARTNGLAVEAVLIYGYDMGSSETLYFYRQNDYDIQSKDASSRAGERNYTITYHLYTADGEPYEATFDNNGKYYDMETAKNTVENKPTGFYAIGSTDLDGKWTSNDPDTVLYKKNGENKDKPGAEGATNVYVLNAEAYHDTYADNLYTLSEVVGGIIPSTAKVVSTVDGCDFDSVSEIARACDNGHLVRISYTYSTSDYKVKTVFITDFKRDAGNLGGDRNPGASLWSSYDASMDRILVFDDVTKNPRSTLAEQLSSAEKALTDAGFTIVDSRTAGMYNKDENTYSWTIEATRVVGNTTRRYFFTGDPAGGQIYGNWYTGAIYTTKVLVNGNLAGYYVPNNTTDAKITVRTVNANKTYDVKWDGGAVVDSVTANEKAVISYRLPTTSEGHTVNFVMNTNPVKPIEAVMNDEKLDEASKTVLGDNEVTFNLNKTGNEEAEVIPGNTYPVSLGLTPKTPVAPPTRAIADEGKFDANMAYTLKFGFSGTQKEQVIAAANITVAADGSALNFDITIPSDAKADETSKKIEIYLISITESVKVPEGTVEVTVPSTVTITAGEKLPDVPVTATEGTEVTVAWNVENAPASGTVTLTITLNPVPEKTPVFGTINGVEGTYADGVITYVLPVKATEPPVDGELPAPVVEGQTVTVAWYNADATKYPADDQDAIQATVAAALEGVTLEKIRFTGSAMTTKVYGNDGTEDKEYTINVERYWKVTLGEDEAYVKAGETAVELSSLAVGDAYITDGKVYGDVGTLKNVMVVAEAGKGTLPAGISKDVDLSAGKAAKVEVTDNTVAAKIQAATTAGGPVADVTVSTAGTNDYVAYGQTIFATGTATTAGLYTQLNLNGVKKETGLVASGAIAYAGIVVGDETVKEGKVVLEEINGYMVKLDGEELGIAAVSSNVATLTLDSSYSDMEGNAYVVPDTTVKAHITETNATANWGIVKWNAPASSSGSATYTLKFGLTGNSTVTVTTPTDGVINLVPATKVTLPDGVTATYSYGTGDNPITDEDLTADGDSYVAVGAKITVAETANTEGNYLTKTVGENGATENANKSDGSTTPSTFTDVVVGADEIVFGIVEYVSAISITPPTLPVKDTAIAPLTMTIVTGLNKVTATTATLVASSADGAVNELTQYVGGKNYTFSMTLSAAEGYYVDGDTAVSMEGTPSGWTLGTGDYAPKFDEATGKITASFVAAVSAS